MQDINHGKYINYLISQSNSEINAATSTAQKRGGRARDRVCRSRKSALPADLRETQWWLKRGGKKQESRRKMKSWRCTLSVWRFDTNPYSFANNLFLFFCLATAWSGLKGLIELGLLSAQRWAYGVKRRGGGANKPSTEQNGQRKSGVDIKWRRNANSRWRNDVRWRDALRPSTGR